MDVDLSSPVGRALARSLGFVVPPEADGSAPCVALPDDSGESEKEFQKSVIEYAQMRGWKVAHFRKSRTKTGWATAVAGDGKGWPDLFFIRGRRVLVRELKVPPNKLTPEQSDWLSIMRDAGIDAEVWDPRDWPEIKRTLE